MLGGIFPSARSALSQQETLNLANFYLESARQAQDPKISLVLCENAKASLSQMKRALRKAQAPQSAADQMLRNKVGQTYFERGQLLERLNHPEKAQASYKKAKKWGYVQSQSPNSSHPSSPPPSLQRAHPIPLSAIFASDVPPPLPTYALPQPDERLTNSPQLAYALSLLSAASLKDAPLSSEERTWSQATAEDADEAERLHTLAADVVRAFINDELKEVTTVTEVVCVALSAKPDLGRNLLTKLVKEMQNPLFEDSILEGIDQLIHEAAPDTLKVDDLVQLLTLLSDHLPKIHPQATANRYLLTRTVSHVLDAMADNHITGLQRERLHEPLAAYLKTLQNSEDPYLVYQAAYAFQALQYVPDDETPWQAALRRTGKVLEGVFGLASAVKGLDINEFIKGIGDIHKGVAGAAGIVQTVTDAYEGWMSMIESGQNFSECIKEGFSFIRKSTWYPPYVSPINS